MSLDLTRYPITLPGQPAGSRLTLADIRQLCGTGFPEARTSTAQERAALVKLAYCIAHQRGAKTIGQLTLEEMLEDNSSDHICPLTFECGPAVKLAPVLAHCDFHHKSAHPLDAFGQLLGWIPFQLWGREREKAKLDNVLPFNTHLRNMLASGRGVVTPTRDQLSKLIVDLERRIATAVSSAGPQWTLTTTFDASTAFMSVEVGEGSKTRVMHAHEFMWVERAPFSKLYEHNDAAIDSETHRVYHSGIEHMYCIKQYRPPLPTFASFVSPSAAVASFVYFANKELRDEDLRWRNKDEEDYYAMATYFCKLMSSVTSGRTFANVLATRPRDESLLPDLEPGVQLCLLEHGTDERHRRTFPTFGTTPQHERKRKRPPPDEAAGGVSRHEDVRVFEVTRVSRTPGESYGDDVIYSWRAARAGSKAEAQCEEEVLKSAVWHYETALNDHTRSVLQAYDGGRGGVDLFQLLLDWPAFYAAVGEEKAEELQRLRDELKEAQENVRTWLKKVVDRRSHEEAVVAA